MRQKLITLDPTSFEIASKMPNFSDWVRQQLRIYDTPDEEKAERDRIIEKMRPPHKYCSHCEWVGYTNRVFCIPPCENLLAVKE